MTEPDSNEPEGSAQAAGADSCAPTPTSSRAGVDLTQIERMLDLSPIDRVRILEDWVNGITELRRLMGEGGDLGEIR